LVAVLLLVLAGAAVTGVVTSDSVADDGALVKKGVAGSLAIPQDLKIEFYSNFFYFLSNLHRRRRHHHEWHGKCVLYSSSFFQ
jgi:hypothetical protein